MVAPTEVSQLTIEYSGNEVVCTTTQINSDSSVYLAGCTVAGRSVDNYTYGSDKTPQAPTYTAYEVGDEVTYNNVDYYVIKDSSASESTVTLLKAEPLTADEIATYSAGTGAQTDGNGGMQYHSSSSAYEGSYVKATVDAWKTANAPVATEARLITFDELKDNLGYELIDNGSIQLWSPADSTPSWVYNSNYYYWTMSPWNDSAANVWIVGSAGSLSYSHASTTGNVVRPVIKISKSVISSTGN